MYLSLYDADRVHLCNLPCLDAELTRRVFDMDSFSARGVGETGAENACLLLLNDEAGNTQYACFVESVRREGGEIILKGRDLRTLWDTDILWDLTREPFDGRLSCVFSALSSAVLAGEDAAAQRIPARVEIPTDDTDTTLLTDTPTETRRVGNAYELLLHYLRCYDYYLSAAYDPAERSLVYRFVREQTRVAIDLADFIREETAAVGETNKTVARVKDAPHEAARYFYRTRDNAIVEGNAEGFHTDGSPIEGRIYPVRTRIFEGETLADACLDAAYELAQARYAACVTIDHSHDAFPVELAGYPLCTGVTLWQNGREWGILPITEQRTVWGKGGQTRTVKLGFRKTLLTEIIKK